MPLVGRMVDSTFHYLGIWRWRRPLKESYRTFWIGWNVDHREWRRVCDVLVYGNFPNALDGHFGLTRSSPFVLRFGLWMIHLSSGSRKWSNVRPGTLAVLGVSCKSGRGDRRGLFGGSCRLIRQKLAQSLLGCQLCVA